MKAHTSALTLYAKPMDSFMNLSKPNRPSLLMHYDLCFGIPISHFLRKPLFEALVRIARRYRDAATGGWISNKCLASKAAYPTVHPPYSRRHGPGDDTDSSGSSEENCDEGDTMWMEIVVGLAAVATLLAIATIGLAIKVSRGRRNEAFMRRNISELVKEKNDLQWRLQNGSCGDYHDGEYVDIDGNVIE